MREKVLIIDDMELNREMLDEILSDEYDVIQAEGGITGMQMLGKYRESIAVVLLDLLMPDVDGYTVLEYMNAEHLIGRIPVLIISTETSGLVEERCFDLGVSDFIRKPFADYQIKRRVNNIVDLFSYRRELERKVERQTATVRRQYQILQDQEQKLRRSNENITDVLATIVEYRNLEDAAHVTNVKTYTGILAKQVAADYPEYGLTPEKMEVIVAASVLHDIGKIVIPDNILLKPARLTEEEMDCMKTHTLRGAEMIESIEGVWDAGYKSIACEIAKSHHEKYDGSGYPDGLKGDEIPVSALIVSIVDAYDALTSERVYKKAYSSKEAFDMITSGQCGVFAPKILDCFSKVREQLEAVAGT